MNKHENAVLEGISAAKSGKKIDSCPYGEKEDPGLLLNFWRRGFRLVVPDGGTNIEDIFTPAFGGPPERDRLESDYVWESRSNSKIGTAKGGPANFEIPPGDWVKLDNYKVEYGNCRNKVFADHIIPEGIYDVGEIPFFHIKNAEDMSWPITDEGFEFVKKYGATNIYIAIGYQVQGIFLFAGNPKKFANKNCLGSIGRGACAVLTNCPKSILIIAEDD